MSQIKLYLALGCIVLLLGGGFTIRYLSQRVDTLKTEKALLERDNAQIKSQANRYANKPKSDADVLKRLRNLADTAKRREGKSK